MAASVQRAVDDILECPICIETMSDSRVLPCIHTFCLACIQQHGNNDRKPNESISCPCCRRNCPVPPGGFQDFPKNILMEKLLEIRGSLVETNNPPQLRCCSEKSSNCAMVNKEKGLSRPCQVPCHNEKGKSVPSANSYCVECKSYMCSECRKRHCRQRLTGSHPVLPTGCPEHPEAPLEFYCRTCKVAICVCCTSSKHRRHKCCSLSDHTNSLEKEVETMKAKLSLTGELEREVVTLKSQLVHLEKLEPQVRNLRSRLTDVKTLENDNREMRSRILSLENQKRDEARNTERLKFEVERLTSRVVHTEELELETEALNWMIVQLMQRPNQMYRIPAETDFAHLCPVNKSLMPSEVTNCSVHESEQLMLICRLCGRRMCLKCYNRKLLESKERVVEPAKKQETVATGTLCLLLVIVILTGVIVHLLGLFNG